MYLTYGLFFMSLFPNFWFQTGLFMIVISRLKHNKQRLQWIIVFLLFMLNLYLGLPNFEKYYRVTEVKPYSISLRKGLNTYELKGNHDYLIDDKLEINGLPYLEDPTISQRIHRFKGTIKSSDIELTRTFSLKRLLLNQITKNPELEEYFSHKGETLFSYFSFQLVGLLAISEIILRKFMTQKKYKYCEVLLILLYGWLFGFIFSIVRVLIKTLVKSREHQCLILLLLYPTCAQFPGFYLVYLPFLIKNFSTYTSEVSESLLRAFLLLKCFGKINIIEMVLFTLLKYISGMISMLSFIGLNTIAAYILKLFENISMYHRFLIVGSPSLLWLLIFLFKKKQHLIISIVLMILINSYNPIMSISMLNVYQGDATLIQFPLNFYTILIDTGKSSSYKRLKQALYKKGVKKLDVLILTHDDEDHSGNKDKLFKEFKVDRVIDSKEEKIPGVLQLLTNKTYEDSNENSLIVYMNALNTRFLFMGDAGKTQENEIIREYPHLKIEVLKLGHHGSKTSSSEMFLKSIQPKVALISSDPKVYNHPHIDVMKRLYDLRITPLETSKEGDISILLLPFLRIIVSERGGFGIMR